MASRDASWRRSPKESFWKRSRHTLGEKYFAFLKETKDTLPAEPETMNVAGDISPDAEGNANAKRRAQIRRSQRAHRARTENYVLGLEAEVGRLRIAHADCVAFVKHLQVQLAQISVQNGYAGVQSNDPVSLNTHSDSSIAATESRPSLATASSDTNPTLNSQIALEFVLRLEHRCLDYVRQDITSESRLSENGDILFSDHCASSTVPSKIDSDSVESHLIGDDNIAGHLLALSSRLYLGDGLITPIQAWELLKSHPRAQYLTINGLNNILTLCQPLVSCHRHGAALNKVEFELILDQIVI